MGSFNPLSVLSYGAIGLGFLLAFLSYQLLSAEQERDHPRQSLIHAIYSFMVFAAFIVVIGFAHEPGKVSDKQPPTEGKEKTAVSNSSFAKGSPALISPEDRQEYMVYPRQVRLTWEPMEGAASYRVQVQLQVPITDTTRPTTEVGSSTIIYHALTNKDVETRTELRAMRPAFQSGVDNGALFEWINIKHGIAGALSNHYQIELPNAAWVRWRVWAVDANDNNSLESDWRTFHFVK